jgi:2-dehydropantoate 2-reductase
VKIVVVGAGGLGGYFGARLDAGGNDVTFIARGKHLEAMLRDGLRVQSGATPLLVRPVQATDRTERVGPADLVIVAVKLWDTEIAAESVRPAIGPQTAVVSFQNGVDAAERIAGVLGHEHVLGGVGYVAATIEVPGVIRHTGTMQRLVFGELNGKLSPRVDAFAAACAHAGVDCEASSDIRRVIWEKFVFIVGLSAVTSLFRRSIGLIRAHARSRNLLLEIMREAVAVGRTSGVALDPSFAEQRVAFVDTLPESMTTSMYTDLQRGNRLELPWLSGKVASLGVQLGVPTPANHFVTDALSLDVNGRIR